MDIKRKMIRKDEYTIVNQDDSNNLHQSLILKDQNSNYLSSFITGHVFCMFKLIS
jgi:hypothetical protein